MSRAEKDRIVRTIIERYDGKIGAAVVRDDVSLTRLLSTLQFDSDSNEVGEFLCSFLVA